MAYEVLQYPTYQPAARIVTSITNAYPALVTTGTITYPAHVQAITPYVHQYISGTIVRFKIPNYFGMSQLNGQEGEITVVTTTTFTVDIDTTMYDPFVIPPIVLVLDPISFPPHMVPSRPIRELSDGSYAQEQYAYVVPFGENTAQLTAAVKNVLPY
jgi:hypothetical protein